MHLRVMGRGERVVHDGRSCDRPNLEDGISEVEFVGHLHQDYLRGLLQMQMPGSITVSGQHLWTRGLGSAL